MNLDHALIQPAILERHFASIALLMSSQETEPTTEESLTEWYQKQQKYGIKLVVAVRPSDEVMGFYGIYRGNLNREGHYGMYLIVAEPFRELGLGSLLYDQLHLKANEMGVRTLQARVRDTCDEGIRFASGRGFLSKYHSIEMMLDLNTWDDRPYEATLRKLQEQGFHFTNMAELGDTREARQKLYTLNNNAAATDPGSNGIPPWSGFEEFEADVCNSSWYRPDGQIVAIDTYTGEWAAMSAITVFTGSDHAYNLFTGTDVRYRKRGLAQAVKALALRKTRTFGVNMVRTSHTAQNDPMIAIDTKLGYVHTPGTYVVEKELG